MLVLETPLNDPNSKMSDHLFYIDTVVTSLFTMELILKVIVMGFLLNGPDPEPSQLNIDNTDGV